MRKWWLKSFEDLGTKELYNLLQLRAEVFVVEQNCPYQDLDGKDLQALHLCCQENDSIIAYSRILDKGISYPGHASIGRVIVKERHRKHNLGRELMRRSIDSCRENYSGPIKISAQCYLENFYRAFGFEPLGASYLEDDIPHIAMTLE
ncbi:MAG TPA: GNAT family N-acetyltransferase [Saprospiraceae bacterium]|nr:GNAT family N-acetyltransferase [Saprospiraceae bacterium]